MPNPLVKSVRTLLFPGLEPLLKLGALGLFMMGMIPALAQTAPADTGVVTGRVSSQLTGVYLANARLTVAGGTQEAVSDANGSYRLTGVPVGTVQVTAEYVGLASVTGTVQVMAGRAAPLDFELDRTSGQTFTEEGKTVVLEKFQVLSDREESAQQRAMNQQRQSPNIKNVVAYDEYPTAGNDNIGETMRFIPGLSLNYPVNYSVNDAVGVSVRGMPSNTTGITIDGLETVGTIGSASRSVDLSTINTSNISTIEVTKVPTSDMSAAGLGGSVNITTKSGFERTKPLFTYDVHATFNPDLGLDKRSVPDPAFKGYPVRPSFRLNYVYPVNQSLAITASLSQENTYAETVTNTAGWNQVLGYMSSYNYIWGFGEVTVTNARLGVDWKLGSKHIFGASYSFRGRDTLQATPAFGFVHGATAGYDYTYVQGAAVGTGSVSSLDTVREVDSTTRRADFKYRYMGRDWNIDFNASYSSAHGYDVPSEEAGYFNGTRTPSLGSLTIRSEGFDGLASTPAGMNAKNVVVKDRSGQEINPWDQNIIGITAVTTVDYDDQVDNGQIKLDARRDFKLGIPFTFRTGLAYNTTSRDILSTGKSYTFGTTAANRLAGNYDLIETTFTMDNVFGRSTQWISQRKLWELYQTTPSLFVLNDTATWQSNVNGTKKFDEDISAGYVRFDTRLCQNRLWLVGGLRYERTEDDGEGPLIDPTAQYVKNADGTLARNPITGAFVPITTNALEVAKLTYTMYGTKKRTSYDNFFPSFNATYSLTKDLLLRVGYAGTIGRPDLTYIIPGITYGARSATTNTQTITVVNAGLKPWTAQNYDLSLESYMFKGGFGSVSVFQKDIKNFFTTTTQGGTPELLALYGVYPDTADDLAYTIATRGNGGDASVRGVEFTYRQNLFFLPKWASGFQVFGNYTRSQLRGSNTADFTGFNPETLSWGVNLNRKRFVLKFNASLQDEVRRGPVSNALTVADTYQFQAPLRSYVLAGEYRINKHLSAYLTWSNFNQQGQLSTTRQYAEGVTPEELKTIFITDRGSLMVLGVKGSF